MVRFEMSDTEKAKLNKELEDLAKKQVESTARSIVQNYFGSGSYPQYNKAEGYRLIEDMLLNRLLSPEMQKIIEQKLSQKLEEMLDKVVDSSLDHHLRRIIFPAAEAIKNKVMENGHAG